MLNLNSKFYTEVTNLSFTQIILVGPKDLGTPAHLILSPRPTSRSKKCPRTDGESRPLGCTTEDNRILGRPQSWERKTPHHSRRSTRGSRDSRPYGLAIGGWWRDNPRRSHHLRIKYTQLTL